MDTGVGDQYLTVTDSLFMNNSMPAALSAQGDVLVPGVGGGACITFSSSQYNSVRFEGCTFLNNHAPSGACFPTSTPLSG